MKAGDIMTVGAATISADASILEAAQMMLEHRISGLPVVDRAENVVGILTERDLLRRAELGTDRQFGWLNLFHSSGEIADAYVHSHGRKVSDAMTRDVVTVSAEAPVGDVVDLMERRGYKRVPVVRDGKVIGIVSRANFLRALVRRLEGQPVPVVDDLTIRNSIIAEVDRNGWMSSSTIDVEVHEGVVVLHGVVPDQHVRQAIRVAAENTAGVQRVTDELAVLPINRGWV